MANSKIEKTSEKTAYDFKKISSINSAAEYLSRSIATRLIKGEGVLWLVSGGSAVAVAHKVAQNLVGTANLRSLTIALGDERYGPIGHKDSNWKKLKKIGILVKNARMVPILKGETATKTVSSFNLQLKNMLSEADYKIGLFGMGADGHTAGILPGSLKKNSDKLAYFYRANDYLRVTITPDAIELLDEAVLYARGAQKYQALRDLETDIPVNIQPAQALKKAGKLTVYNDYVGEVL